MKLILKGRPGWSMAGPDKAWHVSGLGVRDFLGGWHVVTRRGVKIGPRWFTLIDAVRSVEAWAGEPDDRCYLGREARAAFDVPRTRKREAA